MRLLLACTLILAGGCAGAPPPAADLQADLAAYVTPAVESVRTGVDAVPVTVAVREVIQTAVPPPAPTRPARGVSPAAVAQIVRWEVTSPAHYTRRLSRPVWPGGASGVTWGIGYDGGHQTRAVIARDWAAHSDLAQLQDTASITGARAKPLAASMRHVITPYDYALEVFENASLPVYCASARRAYGAKHFDRLPWDVQGVLCGNTYNRGASMAGNRNREKRVIRDVCLPAGDVRCVAQQLRAQCRLWEDTPNGRGLCARRNDEAALAEGSA